MVWFLPFLETPQDYLEEEDNDKLTVCLLQPRLREDEDDPLQATDQVVALLQAAACQEQQQQQQQQKKHIDLFVLPELCPVGYSEDTFANYLPSNSAKQTMYRQIDDKLQQAAVSLQSYICYGTIGWKSKDDNDDSASQLEQQLQYYIRQVVVDPTGHQIASYDKIHLCDYGDCAETRFFTPGETVASFQINKMTIENNYKHTHTHTHTHHRNRDQDWKVGIIICADMRYPNQCRTLTRDRAHAVDVILQPSCFARDISFATWTAFRTTRAVENGVYFVACNYAGDNYGASSMTPPWVDDGNNNDDKDTNTTHLPQVMDNTPGYMIHTLERAVLHHARTTLPFYKHAMQSSGSSSCPACDGHDD
jgi:nitrilase